MVVKEVGEGNDGDDEDDGGVAQVMSDGQASTPVSKQS
jgi:hypothetical protein